MNKNHLYLGLLLNIFFKVAFANGQGISLDGSIGNDHTLTPLQPDNTNTIKITESMGKRSETNLFQSFAEFNIGSGYTAVFEGDNALLNIIARVTGPDQSSIDGTLKVDNAPNADFYLINPNGVVFGSGASVNVPAAFHVSTANRLDFQDNSSFYVDTVQTEYFSTASPADLGFAASSVANNALIDFKNAHLIETSGQSMDFTAGGINFENGSSLTVFGGEIRLIAEQNGSAISVKTDANGGWTLPTKLPNSANAGTITLFGGSQIVTYADVNADSGALLAYANDLSVSGSVLNKGQPQYSAISSYSVGNSTGSVGDITINAAKLDLYDGGVISSQTFGNSDSANINVTATTINIGAKTANTQEAPGITTTSYGDLTTGTETGNSGAITLHTSALNMGNSGTIATTTYDDGHSGDISIYADAININGIGVVAAQHAPTTSVFTSATGTTGSETGKPGNICMHAEGGSVNLSNFGTINSESFDAAQPANIKIWAKQMTINDSFVGSNGSPNSSPNSSSGNVSLYTQNLSMLNGGDIDSSNYTLDNGSGDIFIKANAVSIASASIINADTTSSKPGGKITLNTDKLTLSSGGTISSSASGTGPAGNILINGGLLAMADSEIITNADGSVNNGGDIFVNADILNMQSAAIQANATGGSG